MTAVRISSLQLERVANALSEAFFNDPMFTYILPDAQGRLERLQWFFRSGIRYGLLYGGVLSNHLLEGGAIWLNPGRTTISFLGMLRTGMLAAPFKFGWQAFQRFLTVTNATEAVHKQILSGPHYYLLSIGVKPAKQGKGVGSDLLQPILAQADDQGVPCYLETEQEQNICFYEQHGFYVVHEGTIADGGLRFCSMVREPQ